MSFASKITQKVVGSHEAGSLSATTRQRRWRLLEERFPSIADMHVVDIGGDARAWRISGLRPAHVTLVNIFEQDPEDEAWMSVRVADACNLPADLHGDLVYCNSVIEHVGGHWRRQRLAEGIAQAAPHHWVQTPYRYFPVEPHFLIPGLQFLPKAAQSHMIARWPVGNYSNVHDAPTALKRSMDIELLSRAEFETYFWDSRIETEKFAGLHKSLIAVR